ncbi:MAG: membrane protein insertion efficiency factor YidD [Alphaproteobacteria bacterium]|nr:membrane protein insertion efficiency factor YidD [Alphaproteobacteria bacterium]
MKILSNFGCFLVNLYRVCISPFKVPCCRFQPTCSAYAKEALQKHSFFKALLLISKRLLKCHPWGGCGYDPVPEPVIKKKD